MLWELVIDAVTLASMFVVFLLLLYRFSPLCDPWRERTPSGATQGGELTPCVPPGRLALPLSGPCGTPRCPSRSPNRTAPCRAAEQAP